MRDHGQAEYHGFLDQPLHLDGSRRDHEILAVAFLLEGRKLFLRVDQHQPVFDGDLVPESLEGPLAREKNEALDYTRHYAPSRSIQGGVDTVMQLAVGARELVGEVFQLPGTKDALEHGTLRGQSVGVDQLRSGHGAHIIESALITISRILF